MDKFKYLMKTKAHSTPSDTFQTFTKEKYTLKLTSLYLSDGVDMNLISFGIRVRFFFCFPRFLPFPSIQVFSPFGNRRNGTPFIT